MSAENQLGVLNDSRALGYSGYEPLTDFLSLASQADASMDAQVEDALAARLQGVDRLYDDLPGQNAFRAFGRRLLAPLFAMVGWDARPHESQNITLLRATLLGALSQFDDPAVVAEARKRFSAYLKSPKNMAPDTRRSVIAIVAHHADADEWEHLHALAKGERSTLAKQELYALLGTAKDRQLAQHALDLALSSEAAVTTRPDIVASVGSKYPEMAFDFVSAHLTLVNSWLEADSRNQYAPNIAANAHDAKMIEKLKAFAKAHIPETAQSSAIKAESAIALAVEVRTKRLSDVDRWLSAHAIR
jgi:aminopeptidase N